MTGPKASRRREAKETLNTLFTNAAQVSVIHYSCESFYDRPDGRSPRITSIAVRNLESGQTASFSIHQVAERQRLDPCEIRSKYDRLESRMLIVVNELDVRGNLPSATRRIVAALG